MRIKNTSIYPDDEVRELVTFAMKGIGTTGVMVKVKNTSGTYRGMAYHGIPSMSPAARMSSVDRLITIGIGAAERFPTDNMWRSRRWVEVGEDEYRALPEDERRHLRHWSYADGRRRYQREVVTRHPYGGKRSPLIEMAGWREALVPVAAHEARHHYQMSHKKPLSEVDAEKHAAKVLAKFRLRD